MATKVARELKSKKEQRVAFNNFKGFMLNPFISKSTVPEFQYLKYKKGSPKKNYLIRLIDQNVIIHDHCTYEQQIRAGIAAWDCFLYSIGNVEGIDYFTV